MIKLLVTLIVLILISFCVYSHISINILHNDYVNIFGYTYFVVATGSMSGKIEVDDIIIVKIDKNVKQNDIITYKDKNGKLITHRVIEEINNNQLTTKGDANDIADTPIKVDQIVGKVVAIKRPIYFFKIFASLLIIYVFYLMIDTNKTFIKFLLNKEKVPDELFKSNSKYNELSTGMTIVIPVDEINNMNNNYNKDNNKNSILIFNDDYSEEIINYILNLLRLENKDNDKIRINKPWLNKYQYIYELTLLLKNNNIEKFIDKINNPNFEEIFDYDLDSIGINEEVKNSIYEMPLYVLLKILVYTILYNDLEMFDAIYKILKYKIVMDKNELNNNIDYDYLDNLLTFMKKVSNKYDKKHVFNLEKIDKKYI